MPTEQGGRNRKTLIWVYSQPELLILFFFKVETGFFSFFFFISSRGQGESFLTLRWTLLCLCGYRLRKKEKNTLGWSWWRTVPGHLSLQPSYFGHSFQSQGTNTRWVPWLIPYLCVRQPWDCIPLGQFPRSKDMLPIYWSNMFMPQGL